MTTTDRETTQENNLLFPAVVQLEQELQGPTGPGAPTRVATVRPPA